jgi:hypothetical protein
MPTQRKPPKKSKPKPKSKSRKSKSAWYSIREILEERTVTKGAVETVEYLVAWEDDAETGKKYDPSWVRCASTFSPYQFDRLLTVSML